MAFEISNHHIGDGTVRGFWVEGNMGGRVLNQSDVLDPPNVPSIESLVVSIRWYLGCLKGQLGGAG